MGPLGIASAFRLHDLPEHGVVDVAAAVVADGAANVFGDGVEVADEIFGGLAGEFGMFLNGGVEILHVSGMMHVVMQRHCLLIDDGFEGVVGIRQGG